MKHFLSLSITLLISFSSFSFSHAIDTTGQITLTDSGMTYLEIDWQDVSGAAGYYVHYGKTSGISSGYEEEIPQLIEDSKIKIMDLDAGSDYYISIISVDEYADESEFSKEVMFRTKNSNTQSTFGIINAEAIYANKVEVSFNSDLDMSIDAIREFRITQKNNNLSEIFITGNTLKNKNTLILELEEQLEVSTDYELIVIEITDVNDNIIKSGINSIQTFTTPSVFDIEDPVIDLDTELNNNVNDNILENSEQNEKINTDNNSFQSAPEIVDDIQDISNAGRELTDGEINTNIQTASKNADSLPQTGPEHLLIILLALLLGFIAFRIQSK